MDRDTVLRLAQLSRIQLEPEDLLRAEHQLKHLLSDFGKLRTVPTEGIEPSSYPLPIAARERPDTVGPCLDTDQVLANAPAQRDGQFLVPKVIDA